MPMNGLPEEMCSSVGSARPDARKAATQSLNAPTPGRTTLSADRISSGFDTSRASAPTLCSRFLDGAEIPDPVIDDGDHEG